MVREKVSRIHPSLSQPPCTTALSQYTQSVGMRMDVDRLDGEEEERDEHHRCFSTCQ